MNERVYCFAFRRELTVMRTFPLLSLALSLVPAAAQDPVVVNPKLVKVEFENDQVRILRMRYGPHERLEMHSHPAKAEVQVTDGVVRIFTPDGKSRDDPGSAGQFFWLEPTTHAVENLGNTPLEIIEIEMKKAVAPSVPIAAPQHAARSALEKESIPVQDEPHHHWKFENQYVRVLDVVLVSGESTLFHTHSHDSIAVRLNEAMVQRQNLGKDWEPVSKIIPGDANYIEGATTPYTHRVKNVGTTTFHVIDIELLQ
jgi:quercetin dioxygenase-like cupin family protein